MVFVRISRRCSKLLASRMFKRRSTHPATITTSSSRRQPFSKWIHSCLLVGGGCQCLHLPEGHGKVMCNAQGGQTANWLDHATKTKIISVEGQFMSELNRAAQRCHFQSPIAKGYCYDFLPSPKSGTAAKDFALKAEDMGLKSSFFESIVRSGMAH